MLPDNTERTTAGLQHLVSTPEQFAALMAADHKLANSSRPRTSGPIERDVDPRNGKRINHGGRLEHKEIRRRQPTIQKASVRRGKSKNESSG